MNLNSLAHAKRGAGLGVVPPSPKNPTTQTMGVFSKGIPKRYAHPKGMGIYASPNARASNAKIDWY